MWEELATALKDEPSVVVAEVECPDAKKICDEVGVKGFPTIASSFGGEKKEVFKGARTRGPLEKFARWVFVFDGRRLLAGSAARDYSRQLRQLSTSRYSLLALSPTRWQIAIDPLDGRDGAVVILFVLNESNESNVDQRSRPYNGQRVDQQVKHADTQTPLPNSSSHLAVTFVCVQRDWQRSGRCTRPALRPPGP